MGGHSCGRWTTVGTCATKPTDGCIVYSRTGTLLYETGSGGQPGCAPADDRIFCHGFDPNTGAGSATRYVHLAGRLIAQVRGTDTVYLHTDHLGRPARRTVSTGAELSRTCYGRLPWPGLTHAVHFLVPGQGVPPPRAGWLER